MSWRVHAFLTGAVPGPTDQAVQAALPGFRLGERLNRLDWSVPCIEWYTASARGGLLLETVPFLRLEVSAGRRMDLRTPDWHFALTRALSGASGGYGAAAVSDRLRCRFGVGLFYMGRTLEAFSCSSDRASVDLGRPEGSLRPVLDDEGSLRAAFAYLLEGVTGLSELDVQNAVINCSPRRWVYRLESTGEAAGLGFDGDAEQPALRVVFAVGDHQWQEGLDQAALPESARWRVARTPERTLHDAFEVRSSPYVVVDGADPSGGHGWIDALAERLQCDALAVRLPGNGAPAAFRTWHRGVPHRATRAAGAEAFLRGWGHMAVSLGTNPHAF